MTPSDSFTSNARMEKLALNVIKAAEKNEKRHDRFEVTIQRAATAEGPATDNDGHLKPFQKALKTLRYAYNAPDGYYAARDALYREAKKQNKELSPKHFAGTRHLHLTVDKELREFLNDYIAEVAEKHHLTLPAHQEFYAAEAPAKQMAL